MTVFCSFLNVQFEHGLCFSGQFLSLMAIKNTFDRTLNAFFFVFLLLRLARALVISKKSS